MAKRDFVVGIMHGHGKEVEKIRQYVSELGFSVSVLRDRVRGKTIFQKLVDFIWDEAHCVVVLMTADDDVGGGKLRARQNVVFELGYSFGAFDSLDERGEYRAADAVILIVEKGVETFSDIEGLDRIEFERGKLHRQKRLIVATLNEAWKKGGKFYGLTNRPQRS